MPLFSWCILFLNMYYLFITHTHIQFEDNSGTWRVCEFWGGPLGDGGDCSRGHCGTRKLARTHPTSGHKILASSVRTRPRRSCVGLPVCGAGSLGTTGSVFRNLHSRMCWPVGSVFRGSSVQLCLDLCNLILKTCSEFRVHQYRPSVFTSAAGI